MARLEGVWKILTLRCDEASRLASGSLDHALPVQDRIALRLHQMVCLSCRRYGHQVAELRRISTRLSGRIEPPAVPLPDEVRDRIKRTLDGS